MSSDGLLVAASDGLDRTDADHAQIASFYAGAMSEAREIAIDMLRRVGIPKPNERVDSYPHQLSGGQRQRVMIAVALVAAAMGGNLFAIAQCRVVKKNLHS